MEQFSPKFETEDTDEEGILHEAAFKFGIQNEIPKPGTVAYNRLLEECKKYTQEADSQETSVSSRVFEKGRVASGSRRRQAHDNLCKMLFGTSHKETTPDNKDRAAKFAFFASGREDMIDF